MSRFCLAYHLCEECSIAGTGNPNQDFSDSDHDIADNASSGNHAHFFPDMPPLESAEDIAANGNHVHFFPDMSPLEAAHGLEMPELVPQEPSLPLTQLPPVPWVSFAPGSKYRPIYVSDSDDPEDEPREVIDLTCTEDIDMAMSDDEDLRRSCRQATSRDFFAPLVSH